MSTRQQSTSLSTQDSTSHIQSLHSSIDTLKQQLIDLQTKLNSHQPSDGTASTSKNVLSEETDQDRGNEKDVEEGEQERRAVSKVQEALRRRYGESVSNRDFDDQEKS